MDIDPLASDLFDQYMAHSGDGASSVLQVHTLATNSSSLHPHIPPEPSPPPAPLPPPPPPVSSTGRPTRTHRLPRRFRDDLPERVPALPDVDPNTTPSFDATPTVTTRRVILIVRDRLVTALNSFGLWRSYPRRPSYDPDNFVDPLDLSSSAPAAPITEASPHDPPWPFANMSIHRIMTWLNTGSNSKTPAETTRIVRSTLR